MWNLVNNCHVQIYLGATFGSAPEGDPTLDTPAQYFVPRQPQFAKGWLHRIAVPPTLATDAASILGDGVSTWGVVAVLDDIAEESYQWYRIVDVSWSTRSITPTTFSVDAIFLALQTLDSI